MSSMILQAGRISGLFMVCPKGCCIQIHAKVTARKLPIYDKGPASKIDGVHRHGPIVALHYKHQHKIIGGNAGEVMI